MSIPGSANPLLLASAAGAAGYNIERSLRFNSADSAYLSRTPAVAGNRRTWTWSGWVKRSGFDADQNLYYAAPNSTDTSHIRFDSDNTLHVFEYTTGFVWRVQTSQVFRDPASWYHIVVAVDTTQATASNRVKIYVNGTQVTAFSTASYPTQNKDTQFNNTVGHAIGRNDQNASNYFSGYIADIHFIDGQALTPSSFTEVSATTGQLIPKTYSGTYGTNGFQLKFADNSTAAALGTDTSGNSNNWTPNNLTATELYGRLYRQATGTATSAFSSVNLVGNFPASASGNYIYDAELSTSVTTATFGYLHAFGGVEVLVSNDGTNWTSKGVQTNAYTTVTNSTPFKYVRWFIAQSWMHGITNNPANIDSLVDTPTSYGTDTGTGGEVRGNYCTLNPLGTAGATPTNGNLSVSSSSTVGNRISTFFLTSGKWYWEGSGNGYVGAIVGRGGESFTGSISGTGSKAIGWWEGGPVYWDGGDNGGSTTFTSTDVIGIALDMDAGNIKFYKNNSLIYTITFGSGTVPNLSSGVFPAYNVGTSTKSVDLNFGQRPFAYTAPSGFKALCDTNLPAPVVAKPNTVMDVATWSGDSAASRSITFSQSISPDLVWVKCRSNSAYHGIYDSVRGVNRVIFPNDTLAEINTPGNGYVSAFNSNGFTLTAGSLSSDDTNQSGRTYVGWCFDAGSNTVSNTQGSITSSVRANPSSGFSIVGYTGTGSSGSLGHGLNVKPQLIIVKSRTQARDWLVYHSSYGATQYMTLNGTGAAAATTSAWNNTEPTSTVFTIGNAAEINTNGSTNIAYCFAPVVGYSSFGSYTGNGSTDGPFVYTGFRPRFILGKVSSTTDGWYIFDAARSPYNVTDKYFAANASAAEATFTFADFLSNGFKLRATTSDWNASGQTYIYAAFAENPFQYARAR